LVAYPYPYYAGFDQIRWMFGMAASMDLPLSPATPKLG
jgi:hypothetical protein